MSNNRNVYYAFHKPYGVLCQFTKEHDSHVTLADYISLGSDVYPVGRLDKDSEGLLILTNDNRLKHKLLTPTKHSRKTYLVQVDGSITEEAIAQLEKGTVITVQKKKYHTRPATAVAIEAPAVEERNPPIRYRALIPTSWISITITEGKNRQVRKMCASVGFPVLRLIRVRVQELELGDLRIGELKQLGEKEVRLLK